MIGLLFAENYSERHKKVVIARSEALHRMVYGAKRRACALERYACLREAASAKAGRASVAIS